MADEANQLEHFAHGRRALTTRDGQAAAALADHRASRPIPGPGAASCTAGASRGDAVRPPPGRLGGRTASHGTVGHPGALASGRDRPKSRRGGHSSCRDRPAERRSGACGGSWRHFPARLRPAVMAARAGPRTCLGIGVHPKRIAPPGLGRARYIDWLDACVHFGDLSAPLRLAAGTERPHLATRQPGRPVAARSHHPVGRAGPFARHPHGPPGVPGHRRHHGKGTCLLGEQA